MTSAWGHLFINIQIHKILPRNNFPQFFLLFSYFILPGLEYIFSQRGYPLLVVDNYLFRKNRGPYWRCIRCTKDKCKCRIILQENQTPRVVDVHTHGPETEKINFGRKVRQTVVHNNKLLKAKSGVGIVQLCLRHPHFKSDAIRDTETYEYSV